ncbi:MAG: hypothetical protein ACOYOA_06465 [Saprospiraceae bacterium]
MKQHLSALGTTILIVFSFFKLNAQLKADDYFRSGQYATAAKMFEKNLEKKDNSNIKSKLAFCYRMCNQQARAFELYSELISAKQVKPEIYYYFAESLVQKELYDSARVCFAKYATLEPTDPLNASIVLQNLEEIKHITPLFPQAVLLPFSQNSPQDDNSAIRYKNSLVFTSDRNLGFQLLKEKSDATGRDFLNIYTCEILNDSIFQPIAYFTKNINQKNSNTGAISFTADLKRAYFEQNSPTAAKNGTYHIKIYTAEAEGNGWKNIEKLPFCNDEMNYMHPAISPDGKELFFVSGKQNSKGRADLFSATLQKNGSWSSIQNLGPIINTAFSEGFPYIDHSGKLYFASKGHPGYGGFDLFVSEKDSSGNWKKPVNLGKPINSPLDDISFCFFKERNSGAFSSARNGGDDDIYFFRHKDSSSVFGLIQNKVIVNQEPKGNQEKMTIDAANHIALEPAQMDLCSLFQYCTFERLSELLNQIPDSSLLNKTWILSDVDFRENKISTDSLSLLQLDELVALLLQHAFQVQINVHCFSANALKDNLANSRARGQQLKKHLQLKGIAAERIKTKGMGAAYPICSGKDCAVFGNKEKKVNERVELVITSLRFP